MIKVSGRLASLTIRALVESMGIDIMIILVKKLLPRYDIHKETGIHDNISIPDRDVAAQIVRDIRDAGLFPHFVNELILAHQNGLMGRKYTISCLRDIIKEVHEAGYTYDHENQIFIEDSRVQKTRNWGYLREGEERVFAFLRLDIVGHTALVKQYPEHVIHATYADFRGIVQRTIDKRNGRIWSWEGDGGLVAFFFSHKSQLATLSAMEIVHELFIYNQIGNRLDMPLGVRMAVHNGQCAFSNDPETIKKSDIVKKAVEIESGFTKPNSVTVSNTVYPHLDQVLANHFKPFDAGGKTFYYNYELRWES